MKIIYTTPFTMIANDIIQSEKLTIYQKMVYMVLCSHANQSNACFPSYSTIARECGCSKRKVIDTIGELEELEYIIVHRYKDQNGKHRSNEYEIVVENIVDKSVVGADGATGSESDAPSNSESPAPGSACGAPELYSDNNINSLNNNQSTIDEIFENAELENFYRDEDRQLYKTVLGKMYNSKSITVDGNLIPQSIVRSQLKKIDYEVMAEADNCIRYKPVVNKVGYLISVIYNELLLKI